MSIATKTGDAGETALMYGRRVPKMHRRVEAYGTVDELNAALGMVRATVTTPLIRDFVLSVQKELVILMGELAVSDEDRDRFQEDGYELVTTQIWRKTIISFLNIGRRPDSIRRPQPSTVLARPAAGLSAESSHSPIAPSM
jgi:cobalamin adenosyltransferase